MRTARNGYSAPFAALAKEVQPAFARDTARAAVGAAARVLRVKWLVGRGAPRED